jgi:two-component system response regulator RegX3
VNSQARRRTVPYETVHPETIGHLRLLTVNGVGIDLDGHRVFADGTEIALAPKEFELLHILLRNAGRALSRRQILDAVWGTGYVDQNKTLEVHIRRLRSKLDPSPAVPRIRTVRGVGYVFDIDAARLTRRR